MHHQSSTDFPFSILVDSASDESGRHFFFMYIRLIVESVPYTMFMKSFEIKRSFDDAGLDDVLKTRLVGFISDGAKVMRGTQAGLAAYLDNNCNNNVYKIHCFAHKLQLVILHSFDRHDCKFLKTTFEKDVNSYYNFYNKHAVKRKTSLKITAQAFNDKFLEIIYINPVRFVASELKALKHIHKMYFVLYTDLTSIEADDDFDTASKSKAKALIKTTTNLNFYTTLLFMIDILEVLTAASKEFQKTSSTLIGMEDKLIRLGQQL